MIWQDEDIWEGMPADEILRRQNVRASREREFRAMVADIIPPNLPPPPWWSSGPRRKRNLSAVRELLDHGLPGTMLAFAYSRLCVVQARCLLEVRQATGAKKRWLDSARIEIASSMTLTFHVPGPWRAFIPGWLAA